ncbi:MAG: hypothetical protein MPL62_07520 [Alphaproteobacteria bacterium]|nr:hypothetical protein [Alphaproteobacteria bacterium]
MLVWRGGCDERRKQQRARRLAEAAGFPSPVWGVAVSGRVVYKGRHDFCSIAEKAGKQGKAVP